MCGAGRPEQKWTAQYQQNRVGPVRSRSGDQREPRTMEDHFSREYIEPSQALARAFRRRNVRSETELIEDDDKPKPGWRSFILHQRWARFVI
jgi:hypothetical protein